MSTCRRLLFYSVSGETMSYGFAESMGENLTGAVSSLRRAPCRNGRRSASPHVGDSNGKIVHEQTQRLGDTDRT